jgi:hypothetical protein
VVYHKDGTNPGKRQRITASVFTNDHASPQAGSKTAPAKFAPDKPLSRVKRGNNADAHLKRHGPPSAAVVEAVTGGRLD